MENFLFTQDQWTSKRRIRGSSLSDSWAQTSSPAAAGGQSPFPGGAARRCAELGVGPAGTWGLKARAEMVPQLCCASLGKEA